MVVRSQKHLDNIMEVICLHKHLMSFKSTNVMPNFNKLKFGSLILSLFLTSRLMLVSSLTREKQCANQKQLKIYQNKS